MRGMTRRSLYIVSSVLALACAALSGYVAYITVTEMSRQEGVGMAVGALRTALVSADAFSYGTVEVVDAQNRLLVVRIIDRFSATGKEVAYSISVDPDAPVIRNVLLNDRGTYYGRRSYASTLGSIVPGEKVALVLSGKDDDFTAVFVQHGDPL